MFDLAGTLVDGVSQRVLAWQTALEAGGIELSVWRIHRRIGMKRWPVRGRVAARDRQPVDVALVARLQRAHAEASGRRVGWVRLLPGAHQLRQHLSSLQVPWAVPPAGCWRRRGPPWTYARSPPADVPVVTRDQVACQARPGPVPGCR